MISPKSLNQERKDVNFLVPQYLEEKKFFIFFYINSFNLCGKSRNWLSRWEFRTSGLILTCGTDVLPFCWPSGFLPCRRWLGSKPSSSPLGLELWEMTVSHQESGVITWHKMDLPFSSPSCDPVPGPALRHFMLIKAEISCFSARTVLAASQSWLIFSPWNKLTAVEDSMNIMDTFFTI